MDPVPGWVFLRNNIVTCHFYHCIEFKMMINMDSRIFLFFLQNFSKLCTLPLCALLLSYVNRTNGAKVAPTNTLQAISWTLIKRVENGVHLPLESLPTLICGQMRLRSMVASRGQLQARGFLQIWPTLSVLPNTNLKLGLPQSKDKFFSNYEKFSFLLQNCIRLRG
jgi:hypothetical protein